MVKGNHSGVETITTPRHRALVALLIKKRRRANLTQADVAARLGQHQSWVARLESGQRRIDVVEFIALAEAIGFDPARAVRELLSAS